MQRIRRHPGTDTIGERNVNVSASRREVLGYGRLAITLALGTGAMVTLPACAPKKSPTMEPIAVTETKPDDASTAAARKMDEIGGLVSSLSEKANNLPGRTDAAHRSAMHDVFDNLAQLLLDLAGPEPSGDVRQQIRTIEAA